jgi:hypothetical protein
MLMCCRVRCTVHSVQVANKNDLIAVEEAAVRNMFNNKVDLTKRGDAFGLGDRDKVLLTLILLIQWYMLLQSI